MEKTRIVKSLSLNNAICGELDRQCEYFDCSCSEYVRLLVSFIRDNIDQIGYDVIGNKLVLKSTGALHEKGNNTL